MLDIFDIILVFIMSFGYLFISSKLLQVNINWNGLKIYIGIVILSIVLFILNFIPIHFFKPQVFILSLMVTTTIIFNKSIIDSFISVLLIFLLSIIIECVLVLMLSFIKINLPLNIPFLFNIVILIIIYYLIKLSVVKKLRNYLIDKRPKKIIVLAFFLFMLSIVNFLYINQDINHIYLVIFFYISNILFLTIFINLLLEQNNYERLNDSYKQLLNKVKNYDYLLEQQRISNHENINQLLMVKTLVKDKKVSDYIDSLLEENNNIDQSFLKEVSNIPITMIRGFLYYKYLEFKNSNVDLKLEVGKKVKKINEDQFNNKQLIAISKILGVFIDNAKEAVEKLPDKEIKINIFKNEKNQLLIVIANEFEGTIDLTKNIVGTTTKGKGHGYGLLLVEDIIKKNKIIKNETEIISNVFVQSLFIDLNND